MSDSNPQTTADLTFGSLSVGDVFQITAEHRKANRLPLFTYQKVDDCCADSEGTRGIFRPHTPVVRMPS